MCACVCVCARGWEHIFKRQASVIIKCDDVQPHSSFTIFILKIKNDTNIRYSNECYDWAAAGVANHRIEMEINWKPRLKWPQQITYFILTHHLLRPRNKEKNHRSVRKEKRRLNNVSFRVKSFFSEDIQNWRFDIIGFSVSYDHN